MRPVTTEPVEAGIAAKGFVEQGGEVLAHEMVVGEAGVVRLGQKRKLP